MGTKRIIVLAGVALALLAALSGCTFLVIGSRIDRLLDDLNAASRDQLYLNLDPALPDYDSLKDPAYWDGWFPLVGVGTPYTLEDQNTDTSVGTATVTGTLYGPDAFIGPKTLVVGLVKLDQDWMIETITLDGEDVVPFNLP